MISSNKICKISSALDTFFWEQNRTQTLLYSEGINKRDTCNGRLPKWKGSVWRFICSVVAHLKYTLFKFQLSVHCIRILKIEVLGHPWGCIKKIFFSRYASPPSPSPTRSLPMKLKIKYQLPWILYISYEFGWICILFYCSEIYPHHSWFLLRVWPSDIE